jgi:alpha-beta hydrolase superfamily lysophospholipase
MNAFAENISSFTGQGGVNIFYRHLPAVNEKAQLVVAHGLGEHSGRYVNIFNRLVPAGFSIWALDFRGHGRSGGKRGHVDTFEEYILDLKTLIQTARENRPRDGRLFLLGHSMGGLVALNYTERFSDTLDGVIASSPGLGMTVQIPAAKAFMGKVMSSIWPGLSMGNELDATKISHDPEVVNAYRDDPLVHDRVTARFFTEFLAAMDEAHAHADGITVPVLMQVAGDDHLVDARASQHFFERLGVQDKTLHVYDRLYHEVYNETPSEKEAVIDDLEKWLVSHV